MKSLCQTLSRLQSYNEMAREIEEGNVWYVNVNFLLEYLYETYVNLTIKKGFTNSRGTTEITGMCVEPRADPESGREAGVSHTQCPNGTGFNNITITTVTVVLWVSLAYINKIGKLIRLSYTQPTRGGGGSLPLPLDSKLVEISGLEHWIRAYSTLSI